MKILRQAQFYARLVAFLAWVMLSGLIGMVVGILRPGNTSNNHVYGRVFGWLGRLIMGLRVRFQGLEHLEASQPCIYIVNHQSGIDLATMASIYPKKTVLIGKKQLIYIPIWGWMYGMFGNLFLDRKNRTQAIAGLEIAVAAIKKHADSVWIFPEGTRNPEGRTLLPFKKGAFYMAMKAQVPLVPIVSSTMAGIVHFGNRTAKGGDVIVRVLPPIPTRGLTDADIPKLIETAHAKMEAALVDIDAELARGVGR